MRLRGGLLFLWLRARRTPVERLVVEGERIRVLVTGTEGWMALPSLEAPRWSDRALTLVSETPPAALAQNTS